MARPGETANAFQKEELPKSALSWYNIKRSTRLFKYLGGQRWKFILGLCFLTASAGVGLIFPLKSGELIGYIGEDHLAPETIKIQLYKTGFILLGILLAQAVFSFGRVYFFAQVTENIVRALRLNAFSKIIQMPMAFFSNRQVSELNSRIATDISVVSDAFTINLAEFIRQLIVGIGGLTLLILQTEWVIAKWFLFLIPPLTVIAILFSKRIRKFSKSYQDYIAKANAISGEAFMGISNVKSFTNEKFEIARFTGVADTIRKMGLKYGIFRGLFFSFVMVFVFGSVFFILWQMLYALKVEHSISGASFGTFMMLSLFVAGSLGGLPEQIASIQRAIGATERVFDLIDGISEDFNAKQNIEPEAMKGNICFDGISFRYPSRPEFTVLDDITCTVNAGQTLALVGSSGSGKTTLAAILLRFYNPDKGKITVDGIDISDFSLHAWRKQIAWVPQDVLLFSGTIRDNIAYGDIHASETDIHNAAQKANALDFITSFPDGFNTMVGERGIQLSGGQRQRIAIARAVLKNPKILILDEATSSLDSASEHLVQEALDKLMQGRTSIVIAHRLATIRNADRIVVLHNGKIEAEGTHEQLIENQKGLYYQLSTMQYKV